LFVASDAVFHLNRISFPGSDYCREFDGWRWVRKLGLQLISGAY
jgi:hypothetical protein